MTRAFEFTVPGRPVPKSRPRIGRGGVVYTPTKTVQAERAVATAWMAAGRHTVGSAPVVVTMRFFYARPTSHLLADGVSLSAAGARAGEPGADVDNLSKLILDALNGLAWVDDRQVVTVHASKAWAPASWTFVSLEAVSS